MPDLEFSRIGSRPRLDKTRIVSAIALEIIGATGNTRNELDVGEHSQFVKPPDRAGMKEHRAVAAPG